MSFTMDQVRAVLVAHEPWGAYDGAMYCSCRGPLHDGNDPATWVEWSIDHVLGSLSGATVPGDVVRMSGPGAHEGP